METSKIKKIIIAIILVVIVLIAIILISVAVKPESEEETPENNISINAIKNPEDYTWDDYMALTPEERISFPDRFESGEAFSEWYESAQAEENEISGAIELPELDLGDKAPEDFTLEDYNSLTEEEQMVFPDAFESIDDFLDWNDKVQNEQDTESEEVVIPDVDIGDVDSDELTWEEYETMSEEEQIAFQNSFKSAEEFMDWYNKAQAEAGNVSGAMELPTLDLKGRDPASFTWEEYQAMTEEERMVFPDYFDSYNDFIEWYNRENPDN